MKSYSDFTNLKDFLSYYHLNSPVMESKVDMDEGGKESKEEPLEVIYADQKNIYKNIFKHIIIFTNNRDPKENKTLGNIYDAINDLKNHKCDIIPELHVFVAAEADLDDSKDIISISDEKSKIGFEDKDNTNTLVISRLGVIGEDSCESIVKLLQDRGFLVLNPIEKSELACNKYKSAILFEKNGIPQPNFTLMTKQKLYNDFEETMKEVFEDWSENPDDNKKFECVCKILDGHGGTGVAMANGKSLLPWLQLVFAIDPERQILIQKKEEADGGDIRVHVLTLVDHQVILGAMKRVKISGDFRSNVSLGASAEPVKLTKEQEQIALKVAKISGMPWCAVDIMPLVKGSNKELGDNVVLEINASPGTDGITNVLKTNFINILLSQLTDPSKFLIQNKIAGYLETVKLKFEDSLEKIYLAKLDTGNSTSASTLEVGDYTDDGENIKFKINGKKLTYKKEGTIKVIAGESNYERPYIIAKELRLGHRKLQNVKIAIVKNRDQKTSNLLLNRDTLGKLGYSVHPLQTHILTEKVEKQKVI